jgi:hypothetical protein
MSQNLSVNFPIHWQLGVIGSATGARFWRQLVEQKLGLSSGLRCDQILNGTTHFKKCKKIFENTYLETSGGQSSNLYLNVIHSFNTRVN